MNKKTRQNLFYGYYAILLLILMSWKSVIEFPPTYLRMAFIVAVAFPGLLANNGWLPAAITCFWATTANGFAYSYMPTSDYLYAILMVIAVLISGKKSERVRLPSFNDWWLFFGYVLLINLTLDGAIHNITYTTLVILLFLFFIKEGDKSILDKFQVAFLTLTLVISYFIITMKDSVIMNDFMVQDRVQWVDPNYMGMQVGMGAIIALINLLKFNKVNLLQKILSPVALAMALPAILMTASRGAALCIVGAAGVMMLSTKTKPLFKLIVCLLLAYLALQLYSNHYFDVLLSRIENDDGTGAGRLVIWKTKLEAFGLKNPLHWLFGCGHQEGIMLGFSHRQGFHNDYLAVLCEYGVIGLFIFLKMLFDPIISMNKSSKTRFEIYACLLYSILAFATLEPIESGVVAFYAFMFYTLLKAKYSWDE